MSKTRVFNPLTAFLAKRALDFLKKYAEDIQNEMIKRFLLSLFIPAKRVVDALKDSDPNNEQQVLEIAKQYANTEFYTIADETTKELVKKVPQENIRLALSHLSIPTTNMIKIFSDDNPNNKEQLEQNWLQFVQDPTTHSIVANELLVPFINGLNIDDNLKDFLIGSLQDALEMTGEIDMTGFLNAVKALRG